MTTSGFTQAKPTTPAPQGKHRIANKLSQFNDTAQSKADLDDMDNEDYAEWHLPADKQNSNKIAAKKRKIFLNNFHKSQSLTDSAFHGLNIIAHGNSSNKKAKNNLLASYIGNNSLSAT